MPKRITLNEANQWLKDNNLSDRYEIIYWPEKASDKAKFIDKKHQREFEYRFCFFKNYALSGVEFCLTKEESVNKIKQINLEKYGVTCNLHSPVLKEKIKENNLKKYGDVNPAWTDKVRAKREETNFAKYGVHYPVQTKEVISKINETRISNGYTVLPDEKSFKEWSKEKGCAESTLRRIHRELGDEALREYQLGDVKSYIEEKMKNLLDSLGAAYTANKMLNGRSYDFLISPNNLIIECDGLLIHSDGSPFEKKSFSYHKIKKDFYQQQGYDSLFFREDEINDKLHIVESIIKNKLGQSKKLFARKCKIQLVDNPSSFIEQNHLMGRGVGRGYALTHNDEIVAMMQVKWKKQGEQLEISRFCTKNGISVVGGFSKLLNFVVRQEKPKSVITFIDKRYGSGEYLKSLGFELKNEDLSFRWIKKGKSYHRMKFPGNSGYEHGLFKIWDCGQARWELTTNI